MSTFVPINQKTKEQIQNMALVSNMKPAPMRSAIVSTGAAKCAKRGHRPLNKQHFCTRCHKFFPPLEVKDNA